VRTSAQLPQLPKRLGREGLTMHVHSNQTNPNAQLDAMYSAQKTAAKQEAERTRKKLTEFASKLAGEAASEDYIVKLEECDDSEKKHDRQDEPKPTEKLIQNESADSTPANNIISDWV
jgi:hypothetical protein